MGTSGRDFALGAVILLPYILGGVLLLQLLAAILCSGRKRLLAVLHLVVHAGALGWMFTLEDMGLAPMLFLMAAPYFGGMALALLITGRRRS